MHLCLIYSRAAPKVRSKRGWTTTDGPRTRSANSRRGTCLFGRVSLGICLASLIFLQMHTRRILETETAVRNSDIPPSKNQMMVNRTKTSDKCTIIISQQVDLFEYLLLPIARWNSSLSSKQTLHQIIIVLYNQLHTSILSAHQVFKASFTMKFNLATAVAILTLASVTAAYPSGKILFIPLVTLHPKLRTSPHSVLF